MKKLSPFVAVVLLGVMVRAAGAQSCPAGPGGVPNVAITGALSTIYGAAAANQRVQYEWGMTQQPGSFITTTIPTSKCSVFTDANGNLPTPPAKCTCFPQGASGWLTIGSGEPAKIIFPPFTTANISDILPVNAAMDPIVSEIDLCGAPTDVAMSVSNPPIGTIGPATLCPGAVTGLNGIPICTTPPTLDQVLSFNGTQWCPATNSIPLDLTLHSITGTGTRPFITGMTWNNVIDVRAFGCHGDMKRDTAVTSTNGSNVITSTNNPWVSTDCAPPGVGCTGTVNKAIRIEEPTGISNRQMNAFVGTITGFTNTGSITISSNYAGVGSSMSAAEWATLDDTCMSSVMAYYGDTSRPRNLMVQQTVPVAISQELIFQTKSGEYKCSGWGGVDANGNPTSPIVWFGTTPDQRMVSIQSSNGFKFVGCQVVGATSVPPLWGVVDYQPNVGLATNGLNSVEDVLVGTNAATGEGITDRGNGIGTTTLAANAVADSGTLSLTAAPVGLRPGGIICVLDATNGPECWAVSTSYTPLATTVPLINNTKAPLVTHPAGQTVYWAVAPITYGFGTDWNGTQNDRNQWVNDYAGDTEACFMWGQTQSTTQSAYKPACNASMIGYAVNNAHIGLYDAAGSGVCINYFLTRSGQISTYGSTGNQLGAGDTCGPAFYGDFVGLDLSVMFGSNDLFTPGVNSGGRFFGHGTQFNIGTNMPNGTDFVDEGIGSSAVDFKCDHCRLINNGAVAQNLNPTIRVWVPGPTIHRNTDIGYTISVRGEYVNVVDDGVADNRAIRDYHLHDYQDDQSTSVIPDDIRLTLQGAQTWTAGIANYLQQNGYMDAIGGVNVHPLDTAPTPTTGACVGGGTGEDYRYKVAFGVWDQVAGVYHMQLPGAALVSAIDCTPHASLNATHYMTVNVKPILGASIAKFYRSQCDPSPCADTGVYAFAGSIRVNGFTRTLGGPTLTVLTFQDTNTTPSGAVPTSDFTGYLTASGPLELGIPVSTPSAMATPVIGCPNGTTFHGWFTIKDSGGVDEYVPACQ